MIFEEFIKKTFKITDIFFRNSIVYFQSKKIRKQIKKDMRFYAIITRLLAVFDYLKQLVIYLNFVLELIFIKIPSMSDARIFLPIHPISISWLRRNRKRNRSTLSLLFLYPRLANPCTFSQPKKVLSVLFA